MANPIVYPPEYVLPDRVAYSGTIGQGLIRTTVPRSQANQIQGFNSHRIDLSLTFSMNNDDMIAWYLWVKQYAYYWFLMPVVVPRTKTDPIMSEQNIRFTSDINYQKRGDNWVSLTVAAELIPGHD